MVIHSPALDQNKLLGGQYSQLLQIIIDKKYL